MVEKFDFSSGTSSRSTKLIHGGVRYLQKAVFGLDIEQVESLHQVRSLCVHHLFQVPIVFNLMVHVELGINTMRQ